MQRGSGRSRRDLGGLHRAEQESPDRPEAGGPLDPPHHPMVDGLGGIEAGHGGVEATATCLPDKVPHSGKNLVPGARTHNCANHLSRRRLGAKKNVAAIGNDGGRSRRGDAGVPPDNS